MELLNEIDAGPVFSTGPLYGSGTPVINSIDFPFLEAAKQRGEEPDQFDFAVDELQDTPLDYSEMIKPYALSGEYPFETIIEGIQEQFSDYIGTDDRSNYVDIFYDELHESYAALNDEEEQNPQEIKEALDEYLDEFEDTLAKLFERRLAITITNLDEEAVDPAETEYIYRVIYEFFIINAKENFMKVISKDLGAKVNTIKEDREFFQTVEYMMRYYSPLVIAMGPMEFLRLCDNQDVVDLFEDGKVSGNFLRKYSPRLYQYEEFQVSIVNQIVMAQEVREELLNGGSGEETV